MPYLENVWVELVGSIIVARVRGSVSEDVICDCQERILRLLNDTNCRRVMYDALELEPPSLDVTLTQQGLTEELRKHSVCIAIVVANTRVAFLARLAFGGAHHRVFYSDMPGALRWLEAAEPNPQSSAPL